jgi:hypothetical protein
MKAAAVAAARRAAMMRLRKTLPLLGAHNLSSHSFPLDTLMLLNRSHKFMPTPHPLSRDDLRAAIKRFRRTIRLRCQFGDRPRTALQKLSLSNPTFQPKDAPPAVEQFINRTQGALFSAHALPPRIPPRLNLPPAERAALRELTLRDDIVVKPADKNLGLTIMDTPDYHAAVFAHLLDPAVYKEVSDLQQFVADARATLIRLTSTYARVMSAKLTAFLRSGADMTTPPNFYIMPKLHKMPSLSSPIIGRPIAAAHSWITTPASRFLAVVLNETLPKFPSILLDRNHLLRQLEGLRVHKSALLVTFDVESLYPNVDHGGCVDACKSAVAPSAQGYVGDLLEFVLTHNVVQSQNRLFHQIRGGAMGTNCMPPAAQLYLAVKWENAFAQHCADTLHIPFPSLYWRYIDDGFFIYEGTEAQLSTFLREFGSFLPNIRITSTSSQFRVEFLDVVIEKRMEQTWSNNATHVGLRLRTHQKALNRYLYIPFTSHHSYNSFKGFILAELIRYVVTNTDECWYEAMVEKFTLRLERRLFPLSFIRAVVAQVSFHKRHEYLAPKPPSHSTVIPLVLPFAQRITHLNPSRILREQYAAGGAALHAHLPTQPIVAFSKTKNLGAALIRSRD